MSRTKTQRRQLQSPRICLFCGTTGPLTDEHIFGDWLHKLGFTGEGVRKIGGDEEVQPIIQKGGPFSKKLRVVCRPCNTKWMSVLEMDAKPLLTALFNANGASVELDENTQLVLARWAFKTAAVAAQVTGKDPFPETHRREFYFDDRPPRHAQVRIGTASIPTQGLGLLLGEYKFRPMRANVSDGTHTISFPFYRASFRLLTVVFDIVGYVTDDIELKINPDESLARALLPIWPSRHPKIWWPPTVNLNVIGGVSGLASGQLVSIPTFVPNTLVSD